MRLAVTAGLLLALGVMGAAVVTPAVAAPSFETDKVSYVGGETALVTASGLDACAGATIELGLFRDQQATDGIVDLVTVALDGTATGSVSLPLAGFAGWAGARASCIEGGFAISFREIFALPVEQAPPNPVFATDHVTYASGGPVQVVVDELTNCAGDQIELGLTRSDKGGTSLYNRVPVDDAGHALTEITIPGNGTFVGWPGARGDCLDGGAALDPRSIVAGDALAPVFLYTDGNLEFGRPAAVGVIGLTQCAGQPVEIGFWRSGPDLAYSNSEIVDAEGRVSTTLTVPAGVEPQLLLQGAIRGDCIQSNLEFGGLLGNELITVSGDAPEPPPVGSGLAPLPAGSPSTALLLVVGALVSGGVTLAAWGYRRGLR